MKFALITLLCSQVAFATMAKGTPKKWLTFKSKIGFSFEHLECNKIFIGGIDSGDTIETSTNVALQWTPDCDRNELVRDKIVMIEYLKYKKGSKKSTFQEKLKSAKRGMKYRPIFLESSENEITNSHIFYIEKLSDEDLRWKSVIFCNSEDSYLEVTGPEISKNETEYLVAITQANGGKRPQLPINLEKILNSIHCQ